MNAKVATKLFRNGGSKAVRLPAQWVGESEKVELAFDEITGRITIIPEHKNRLAAFFALQDELGPIQADESLFERDQGTDDFHHPFEW